MDWKKETMIISFFSFFIVKPQSGSNVGPLKFGRSPATRLLWNFTPLGTVCPTKFLLCCNDVLKDILLNDGRHHVSDGKNIQTQSSRVGANPRVEILHISQTIHNFVPSVIRKILISLSSYCSPGIYVPAAFARLQAAGWRQHEGEAVRYRAGF